MQVKQIKPIMQLKQCSTSRALSAYHSCIQCLGLWREQIKSNVPTAYINMENVSPWVTPSLLYRNVEKPF